jgi:pimeloyl-ACP methyl ester carboxylesterase
MVFVTSDGSQIFYQTFGDRARPTVVLLHGNSGSTATFTKHIPLLTDTFFVVTVDARGHGHSTSASSDFGYDQFVSDLEKLRQVLAVPRWSIIGYSDGANLALRYAVDYPKRVERLVLNAPNIKTNGLHFLFFWGAKLSSWLLAALSKVNDRLFRLKWLRNRIMFETPNITFADLGKIQAPALVVVGQFDVIKLEHSKAIVAALPHGRLRVIPKRTHLFLLAQPQAFIKIIKPFLRGS